MLNVKVYDAKIIGAVPALELQFVVIKADHEAAIAEKDARIAELESADKDHKELNRKLANRNANLTEKLIALLKAGV